MDELSKLVSDKLDLVFKVLNKSLAENENLDHVTLSYKFSQSKDIFSNSRFRLEFIANTARYYYEISNINIDSTKEDVKEKVINQLVESFLEQVLDQVLYSASDGAIIERDMVGPNRVKIVCLYNTMVNREKQLIKLKAL